MTGPRKSKLGRCPTCGFSSANFLYEVTDRLCGVPGEFTYVRCASCRTIYQEPMVVQEDLELCYPASYYSVGIDDNRQEGSPVPARPRRRFEPARHALQTAIIDSVRGSANGSGHLLGKLFAKSSRLRTRAFGAIRDDLIPRSLTNVRALDIGCGTGRLIGPLQKAGWEVDGIEWNPSAAKVASAKTRNHVWVGDFRNVDLPVATYDLILLNHVLEHLDDPQAALRRVEELLAPGGRGVFYYPNPESLGARLYGADWFPLEAPRHLVMPSVSGLAQAAARIGFKVLRTGTQGDGAGYFAHSRSYKACRPIDMSQPEIRMSDRLIWKLERFLNRFSGRLGSEAAVVLQKP